MLTTILTAFLLTGGSPFAYAATNVALGGIGGINNGTLVGGDGTGSARIELNSRRLELVKQARHIDGTVLPGNADVSPGQEIYFVLLIDNSTDVPAENLTIDDPLDESQFTYVPDSLETTIVPSGSDDTDVWSAPWVPRTDARGAPDDVASAEDTGGPPDRDRITAGAVSDQANQTVTVAARTVLAVRFRVRVD